MKKIVVKEINQFVGMMFDDKIVMEYIIYLMVDDINVEAHTAIGEEELKMSIKKIVSEHHLSVDGTDYTVETVTFDEIYNRKDKEIKKMEKTYPLIIVFYLDAEMMKMPEIITPFADSVNEMLAHKQSNVLAFFIPTQGEERVECLNPTIMAEADMEKINKMVEDIKENFAVGIDINVKDEEITLNTKDEKEDE